MRCLFICVSRCLFYSIVISTLTFHLFPPQLKLLWIYMDLHEVSNDVDEDSILQHPCDVGTRMSPLPVSRSLSRAGSVVKSDSAVSVVCWGCWMIVMITFRFFVGQVLMSVGCVWSPCCLRPKGVFGLALFLLCLHFGLVGCSGCVLIRCESLWHRVHCCCHVDFFFLSAILSLLPLSIHLWNALLGEQ